MPAFCAREKDWKKAADILAGWQSSLPPATGRPSFELASLITNGRLLVEAALIREESRGAHYRSDFPGNVKRLGKTHYFQKVLKGIVIAGYRLSEKTSGIAHFNLQLTPPSIENSLSELSLRGAKRRSNLDSAK